MKKLLLFIACVVTIGVATTLAIGSSAPSQSEANSSAAASNAVTCTVYDGYVYFKNNTPNRYNINFDIYGHNDGAKYNSKTTIRAGHFTLTGYSSTNVTYNKNSKYNRYSAQFTYQPF